MLRSLLAALCLLVAVPALAATSAQRRSHLQAAADAFPYDALQAATRTAADFLGLGERIGTIEPGKEADRVLLEGDPLVDIANAERLAGVVLRGRWLTRSMLQDRLAALAATYEAPPQLLTTMPSLPNEGELLYLARYRIQRTGTSSERKRSPCGA